MKKVKKGANKARKAASKAAKKNITHKGAIKNSVGVMPMGDRVLVKPLSADESATATAFGILIPDSSKEKPEQGLVVAVGPGKKNDGGSTTPMSVKVGDRVMFSKYGFDEIKVGGVEYLILPESSILAIIS